MVDSCGITLRFMEVDAQAVFPLSTGTSRKQGFGSGLASPLVPVHPRTGTHGCIRPGSCGQGAGRASLGICPGWSGTICPGSRHEPGPMGVAPGPDPLVPVRVQNRDKWVTFRPGSLNELGSMSFLYITPRPPLPLLYFFWPDGGSFVVL